MAARNSEGRTDPRTRRGLTGGEVATVTAAVQRLVDQARPVWDETAEVRLQKCTRQLALALGLDAAIVSELEAASNDVVTRFVIPVPSRSRRPSNGLDAIEVLYDEREDPPWRLCRGRYTPSDWPDTTDDRLHPGFSGGDASWYANELTPDLLARAAADRQADESTGPVRLRGRWGRRTYNKDDVLTQIWFSVQKLAEKGENPPETAAHT